MKDKRQYFTEIVDKLLEQDISPTYESVGSLMNCSRQNVHALYHEYENLLIEAQDRFKSNREKQRETIVRQAIKPGTKAITPEDLNTFFKGKIPVHIAKRILRQHGVRIGHISHDPLKVRIEDIDTSTYTIDELYERYGQGIKKISFAAEIYRQNIPHQLQSEKNSRLATLLARLNVEHINPAELTSKELHARFGDGMTLSTFRPFLTNKKVPYKKVK